MSMFSLILGHSVGLLALSAYRVLHKTDNAHIHKQLREQFSQEHNNALRKLQNNKIKKKHDMQVF